jgi:hypothetical protein
MIEFSKTSELSKAIAKNERARGFQESIVRMQKAIVDKTKTINNRVKAHIARVARLTKNIEILKNSNVPLRSDFKQCYEDFKNDILGVDGSTIANLIDDRMQKDLDKCTSPQQEEVVKEYHRIVSQNTLQRVELLTSFYSKLGLHVVEKPEKEADKEKETVKKKVTAKA